VKILFINKFFFLKGGSENSFFETAKLLEKNGHEVAFFSTTHPKNVDSTYSKYFISGVNFEKSDRLTQKVIAAGRILYSFEAKRKLERLVKEEKPELIHLHNIYHQISPSILHTLQHFNVPVVMTLHDYKMVCPVYTLFNKGRICEKCLHKKFYHCLLQKCCKDSYLKSFLATIEMYLHHNILNIYKFIDAFICPSYFLKEKIEALNYHAKVFYVPNFINIHNFVPSYTWTEKTLVYFGRLSQEKGLFTLLSAIKGLGVTCKIIGDGPTRNDLEKKAKHEQIINVVFLGYKPQKELIAEIQKAMFVVLPSEWFENNPFSIIEAFALGKPVLASRIGGIPELVTDFKTGLTFEPGTIDELRNHIQYLSEHSELIVELGKNARRFAEQHFCSEKYFRDLMNIYHLVMKSRNNNGSRHNHHISMSLQM
jgi:glycosyltransferase involved in cell wall biosynthesis